MRAYVFIYTHGNRNIVPNTEFIFLTFDDFRRMSTFFKILFIFAYVSRYHSYEKPAW